jgi:hypothetical protein
MHTVRLLRSKRHFIARSGNAGGHEVAHDLHWADSRGAKDINGLWQEPGGPTEPFFHALAYQRSRRYDVSVQDYDRVLQNNAWRAQ